MRLRYLDISQKQKDGLLKKGILNGCGPRDPLEQLVPELAFKPACFEHDFDYWVGGSHQDRKEADFRLLKNMVKKVNLSKKYDKARKRLFRVIAYGLYYPFVFIGTAITGMRKTGYHYTATPRTMEEVKLVLEN